MDKYQSSPDYYTPTITFRHLHVVPRQKYLKFYVAESAKKLFLCVVGPHIVNKHLLDHQDFFFLRCEMGLFRSLWSAVIFHAGVLHWTLFSSRSFQCLTDDNRTSPLFDSERYFYF